MLPAVINFKFKLLLPTVRSSDGQEKGEDEEGIHHLRICYCLWLFLWTGWAQMYVRLKEMRQRASKAYQQLQSAENPIFSPLTCLSWPGESPGLPEVNRSFASGFLQARGCIPVPSHRLFQSLQHLAGAGPALAIACTNYCHPTALLRYSSAFGHGIVTPDSWVGWGGAFVSQRWLLCESAEYQLFSFMLDNTVMLASRRKFYLHERPFP